MKITIKQKNLIEHILDGYPGDKVVNENAEQTPQSLIPMESHEDTRLTWDQVKELKSLLKQLLET